jgi:DNA-binding MarR family transcriptional regulator
MIQLAQVLVRLEEHALNREFRLSYRQMRILKHVAAGTSSATELANRFGVTAPAISSTLESLVKRELLARAVHENDRRSVKIVLTEAGTDVYRQAQQLEDRIGVEILETLTGDELEQFGGLIRSLLELNQPRLLNLRAARHS